MTVEVIGETISDEEKQAYIDHVRAKTGRAFDYVKAITIKLDGEFVDLTWRINDIPFDRIRRITGYLVGTLDRFNNGKRAEVADRVHHGYDEDYYQHEFSGLLEER